MAKARLIPALKIFKKSRAQNAESRAHFEESLNQSAELIAYYYEIS
jgi:hypothetical protein